MTNENIAELIAQAEAIGFAMRNQNLNTSLMAEPAAGRWQRAWRFLLECVSPTLRNSKFMELIHLRDQVHLFLDMYFNRRDWPDEVDNGFAQCKKDTQQLQVILALRRSVMSTYGPLDMMLSAPVQTGKTFNPPLSKCRGCGRLVFPAASNVVISELTRQAHSIDCSIEYRRPQMRKGKTGLFGAEHPIDEKAD